MGEGLLIGTDGGKVKKSAYAFERGYEELDVVALQVIDEILKASDGPVVIDQLKFSELAYILQVATAFVIYHKVGVDVLSQSLVIRKEGVDYAFLDVSEVDGHDGCDPAQERRDKLILFAVFHDIPS